MIEEWQPVAENPRYSVSNFGNVRGPYGNVLKPQAIKNGGHLTINWQRDKKHYRRYIHRLVLEAFVGPCPDGMEVLHLDDDPTNNHIDNLRYGTHAENMATLPHKRLTDDDVRLIRSGIHYNWELCDHFKISKVTVCQVKARKTYAYIM